MFFGSTLEVRKDSDICLHPILARRALRRSNQQVCVARCMCLGRDDQWVAKLDDVHQDTPPPHTHTLAQYILHKRSHSGSG